MKQYVYAFYNVYLQAYSLGSPNITPPEELASQFQALAFRDPDSFASQNLPECEVYLAAEFDDKTGRVTALEDDLRKVVDLSTVYKSALRSRKAKADDMEAKEDA